MSEDHIVVGPMNPNEAPKNPQMPDIFIYRLDKDTDAGEPQFVLLDYKYPDFLAEGGPIVTVKEHCLCLMPAESHDFVLGFKLDGGGFESVITGKVLYDDSDEPLPIDKVSNAELLSYLNKIIAMSIGKKKFN